MSTNRIIAITALAALAVGGAVNALETALEPFESDRLEKEVVVRACDDPMQTESLLGSQVLAGIVLAANHQFLRIAAAPVKFDETIRHSAGPDRGVNPPCGRGDRALCSPPTVGENGAAICRPTVGTCGNDMEIAQWIST